MRARDRLKRLELVAKNTRRRTVFRPGEPLPPWPVAILPAPCVTVEEWLSKYAPVSRRD